MPLAPPDDRRRQETAARANQPVKAFATPKAWATWLERQPMAKAATSAVIGIFAVCVMCAFSACAPRPTPTKEASPSTATGEAASAPATRQEHLDSGAVYFQACAICHGKNGRGGRGPAVANSDYVLADRERLIRTVLAGVREPIHVNGVRWKTGEMLGWAETWDDFKIAAVLTYIRAALNDTLVTDCVPEDFEAGTWASCTSAPRAPEEIASDSVSVAEVAAVRIRLGLPPPSP